MGDNVKAYIVAVFSVLLASCASTGISVPGEMDLSDQQKSGRFAANYVSLERLYNDLQKDAEKFQNEGRALNGLSATAATATLAFASFDAHADNILASTLVGGVSGATATQLKPGSRARLRVKGMAALSCIAGKAAAFEDATARANQRLNAGMASAGGFGLMGTLQANRLTGFTASSATGRSSYDVLDDLLYIFISIAQANGTPTDALQTAIATAQDRRAKLALGIKAQNEAFSRMADAIEAVRTAVEKETPPSISALLEAISKVEIPTASPTPPAGSALAQAQLFGGPIQGQAITPGPNELAVLLGFLSSKVDQLDPEMDATIVKGMTACVAEMATAS